MAEHLGLDGCPLCTWRRTAERRFVDALIAEAVTDPGVRRRIEAAGGWCSAHTALLPVRERTKRGGTLGTAIVLSAVLRARRARFDEVAVSRGRTLRARGQALTRPAACPVCADIAGSAASAVAILLGRVGDPAWAAALAGSPFCADDLALLWATAAQAGDRVTDAWRPIGAAHARRLDDALALADGYIAHSAHDRQHELTDDERSASDTLVRLLAGDPKPDAAADDGRPR